MKKGDKVKAKDRTGIVKKVSVIGDNTFITLQDQSRWNLKEVEKIKKVVKDG